MAIGSNANGEDWPEDIVTEILLRLPVKSMVRFKCVAKTWYDLFENPSFIFQHRRLTKSKAPLLFHYVDFFKTDVEMVICSFDDQTLLPCGQELSSQLPHHIVDKLHRIRIDNGLVCLFDQISNDITLWNPATKETRILPRPPPPPNLKTLYYLTGFGLDPTSNDYKVITVCQYPNYVRRPSVYSMSTDSWRVIKDQVKILEDIIGCNMDACVNGVYYWQVITVSFPKRSEKLLAFDLSSETFQLIELPPGESNGKLLPFYNDGGICFWREARRRNTISYYGVWMLDLDEEVEEGHWTQVMRIENVPQVFNMFCLGGEKNFILVEYRDEFMVVDIDAGKSRDDGLIKHSSWLLQVCPYQESIVPIGR